MLRGCERFVCCGDCVANWSAAMTDSVTSTGSSTMTDVFLSDVYNKNILGG